MSQLRRQTSGTDRRASQRAGFTLTEVVVALAITMLILSIASFTALGRKAKNDAKICIGNQRQIFSALNEFGNDNSVTVGTLVTLTTLSSKGYLKLSGPMSCPKTGQTYSENQYYGIAPLCPASDALHFFNPAAPPTP